jgi:hypothetical protein
MHAKTLNLLVLAAATACASHSSPSATGGSASQTAVPATRNRDIITVDELHAPAVSGLSVLEAVKTLRPHFLTVRGLNTVPAKDADGRQVTDQESGKVHVSLDGNKIVALEELNGIRAGTVIEVRYLNPSAAMQKFGGTAREGPVILVKTM